MINNRQNGRRRGRGGGPRTPNMTGGSGGNRQDNRSRGNASQLHEKYKTLARDAQMAGDRVQTEYYHQFADHYYRVLNEMRSRYDEQRPARGDQRDDQYDDDEDQQDDVQADHGRDNVREDEDRRPQRRERYVRPDGDQDRGGGETRETREPRNPDMRNGEGRSDEARELREERPRRPRNAAPRRDEGERADGGQRGEEGERIAFDVLPPSIGVASNDEDGAAKPRRRARRKPLDGDEIAPAV